MLLPELSPFRTSKTTQEVFGGINKNLKISENEFADMKNMTSDYFPVIGSRKKRKIINKYSKNNGVINIGDNIYTAGTNNLLYKNGDICFDDFGKQIVLENSKKTMAVMGAYLIILPDKIVYNTETNEVKRATLNVPVTQQYMSDSSIWVRYKTYLYMSDEEGNPYLDCSSSISSAEEVYIKHITDAATPLSDVKIIPFGCGLDQVKDYYNSDKSRDYIPKYLCYDKESGNVMMEEYGDIISPVDVYCTLRIMTDSVSDANNIESVLNEGDYLQYAFARNSEEIAKEELSKSESELFDILGSNVYIQKIIKSDNIVLIVLKGVDLWSWMKKSGYMLESTNASASNTVAMYQVANVSNMIPFPRTRGWKLVVKKEMPDMDFVTVSENRMWGCSSDKHEIYASKLGDACTWNQFSGLSSDSYTVTVGSQGKFTGACTYDGRPHFFKENLIITMYGSKPSNYQLMEIEYPGVEEGSDKSLVSFNSHLYYKGIEGIYRFNGSSSTLISSNFGTKRYKDAISAYCNKKMYVSVKENEECHLYVYDTINQLWHREDDLRPECFVTIKDSLYAVLSSGDGTNYIGLNYSEIDVPYFEQITDETNLLDWMIETGDMCLSLTNKKYIQKINIRISSEIGSSMRVYMNYDNKGWEHVQSFNSIIDKKVKTFPVKPKRCDHLRMRIEGTGDVKIYSIEKTITEGSDL